MHTKNCKNRKIISQEIYKGGVVDIFSFCIGKSQGYLSEFYGGKFKGGVNRGVGEGMCWQLLC